MSESSQKEICRRVAKVRLETEGPRGKSSFAKKLGLSASTYDYYEATRIPPADVLVKIAELAGVDLRWLLTGEESAGSAVPPDHPVLQRAAKLLCRHKDAAGPLGAFLDILAKTLEFPKKQTQQAQPPTDSAVSPRESAGQGKEPQPVADAIATGEAGDPRSTWIPILGRSAAGVPHFWADGDDTTGLTTLGDLVARHTADAVPPADVHPAAISDAPAADEAVQIITLREPDEQGQPVEFIAAANLKAKYPDAFAVRIDGESMSPEILHGDLVVLSPTAPAAAGKAAVVQLDGAIGVTCKLYHPAGQRKIHLVPINETFPPTTVEAGQILWALCILAKIRP